MYNNDIFDYCCDQKKGKIITSDCLDKSSGGELWPGSDCRDPCTFWQHAARVQVKFSINISSTQHHHRLQHYADDDSAQPADTKSIFLRRTAGGVHTAGRVVTAPTIMWEKIPLKKTRKISWKQTSSYCHYCEIIWDLRCSGGWRPWTCCWTSWEWPALTLQRFLSLHIWYSHLSSFFFIWL